jgi:hypothetical protein
MMTMHTKDEARIQHNIEGTIVILEDIRKQYLTVLEADAYKTLPRGVNILNRLADAQNLLEGLITKEAEDED